MQAVAHQRLADGLARVVGARRLQLPVAERQPLLGGAAGQLQGSRLPAPVHPAQEVEEVEGGRGRRRSPCGSGGHDQGGGPARGAGRPVGRPAGPRCRGRRARPSPSRAVVSSAASSARRAAARSRSAGARGGALAVARLEEPSASSCDEPLGAGVVGRVLVEDALLAGLRGLAQRQHGLAQEPVVEVPAARADRGHAHEGDQDEPALGLGEPLEDAERGGAASRSRSAARPSQPGAWAPVRNTQPGGQSISTRRFVPQQCGADELALGGAGALAPALPAQGAAHPIFTMSRSSCRSSSALASRSSGRGCRPRSSSLSIDSGTPGASVRRQRQAHPLRLRCPGGVPVRRWYRTAARA